MTQVDVPDLELATRIMVARAQFERAAMQQAAMQPVDWRTPDHSLEYSRDPGEVL